MKILLTGGNGQLGRDLLITKPENLEILSPSRQEFNLLKPNECYEYVLRHKPRWIINCAAYTAVDLAEKNKKEAFLVNSESPKYMANAISKCGGKLLQLSTDFVFDGNNSKPYKPSQSRNPINVYGQSKAEGEIAVEDILKPTKQYLILRTSWLMGSSGSNFALKMLDLHKKQKAISVVNDQYGSPTTTNSLSKAIWKLIDIYKKENVNLPLILHWSDLGIATWFDISVAVGEIGYKLGLLNKPVKVLPISTKDYPTDARRPKYSCLDSSMSQKLIGMRGIFWKENLLNLFKDIN